MWTVVRDGWASFGVWNPDLDGATQMKEAVFNLTLPRFPKGLWELSDLAAIKTDDTDQTAAVHHEAATAWQQQALETMAAIWRWRHNIEDGAVVWSQAVAVAYLTTTLRSSMHGLGGRLARTKSLRDPRLQLLAALANGYDGRELAPPPSARSNTARNILFFDGGSRGNPGPGGAGAVIVQTDADGIQTQVEWSACMSFAQTDMTNNRAEYLGAIAGLREAKDQGWKVEVVGDSNLILRQLREYRPPRNAALRSLYSEARRLADLVQVDVWQHHVRAFNKMADAAANVAMDTKRSVQTSHPSTWPHVSCIEGFLASDFQEWHTRHLLRSALD